MLCAAISCTLANLPQGRRAVSEEANGSAHVVASHSSTDPTATCICAPMAIAVPEGASVFWDAGMKTLLHHGWQGGAAGSNPTETFCFPAVCALSQEQLLRARERHSGCAVGFGRTKFQQQRNSNVQSFPLLIFLQKKLQLSGMLLHNSKS